LSTTGQTGRGLIYRQMSRRAVLRKAGLLVGGIAVSGGLFDLIAACGNNSSATGQTSGTAANGTIRIGNYIDLITFDPHIAQEGPQITYLIPIYEGLTRVDQNGNVVPSLATSWKTIDPKTIEFSLRKGVTFHDGTPFDAQAVKLNIERSKQQHGQYSGELQPVDSVEVIDSSTVRFHLSSNDLSLLFNLAEPPGMMISPKSLDAPDKNPIGTGPWAYDTSQSVRGQQYVYQAYKKYWDPSIQKLATIKIVPLPDNNARNNALQSGQVDVNNEVLPQQVEGLKQAGFAVLETPTPLVMSLMLIDLNGSRVPQLADPRVRQAMNYAIDRAAIVKSVAFGLGTPSTQVFPKTSWAHNPSTESTYKYDPEKAKSLLAQAGVTKAFTFTCATLSTFQDVTQAVQEYLSKVNINLDIKIQAPGTLGKAGTSGKYDSWLWPNGQTDPVSIFTSAFTPNGAFNPLHWSDSQLNQLGTQAQNAPDQAARAKIYQQICARLTEVAPWVPIYNTPYLTGASKNVHNLGMLFEQGVPELRETTVSS